MRGALMLERQPPHDAATVAAEHAADPAAFVSRRHMPRQQPPLALHAPPHAGRQPLLIR
jgi:hypothetical protein